MLLLKRVDQKYLGIDATYAQFGMMTIDGTPIVTVERPWISDAIYVAGKTDISCVPPGEYIIKKDYSPKYKRSMYYILSNKLGVLLREDQKEEDYQRWGCMFHSANWAHQLNGCIALGLKIDYFGDKYGVSSSRQATSILYDYLDKDGADLRLTIE